MTETFPELIRKLPQAEMPLKGVEAFISQSNDHQVVFMEFTNDVDVPEHAHESQWEIILEGELDITIGGKTHHYTKGERFYVPKGVKHSARVHKGYTAVVFFDQKDRYKAKKNRQE